MSGNSSLPLFVSRHSSLLYCHLIKTCIAQTLADLQTFFNRHVSETLSTNVGHSCAAVPLNQGRTYCYYLISELGVFLRL